MKNGVGTAEDGTSKVNPVRFPKQITPKKGSVKKKKRKKAAMRLVCYELHGWLRYTFSEGLR